MTKTQVEVITSVQRRRWSRAEKERIVAAAVEPGSVASERNSHEPVVPMAAAAVQYNRGHLKESPQPDMDEPLTR